MKTPEEIVRQGQGMFSVAALPCAVLTVGFGAAALLGWSLGLSLLASFGSGLIPMAPSTALFFVLYGAAAVSIAFCPPEKTAARIGMLIGSAGSLLSLILLVLSSMGVHPDAEHLGFRIAGTLNGAPVGHMSPMTAFCFLLAGLSFIALRPSPSRFSRQRRTNAALGLALLLVVISFVSLVSYLFGLPIFYGTRLIPPALSTSLAFLTLGAALLVAALRPALPDGKPDECAVSHASSLFVIIFVLMATGIITTGYLYYRNYENHHRAEMEHQLSAIADLKVAELKQWRKERLSDAAVFYRQSFFFGVVLRYFEAPGDLDAKRRLHAWLRTIREANQYERVCLHDADGRVRLTDSDNPGQGTELFSPGGLKAIGTGQVVFEDFYRPADDRHVQLNILAPIISDGDHGDRAIGLLALHIDPDKELYPLIRRWPTPSPTAETLIVRREGNDILFLNELRFSEGAALNLRIPLARKDVPAVQAVLGREGIVEGRDYRDVPVIAAVRAVPESPWFLVARMDASEVYAPVQERRWLVLALVGALLIGAASGVGLVWRQQRIAYFQEKSTVAAALLESEGKYRTLAENIPQRIFTKDRNSVYVSCNENFARDMGLAPEELVGKTDYDLFSRELADKYRADDLRIISSGIEESYEEQYSLHGEEKGWVQMVKTPVRDKDGNTVGILGVYSDITERKRAEEALRENEAFIKLVLDNLPVGVAVNSADPVVVFKYMNDNFPKLYRTTREKLADPDVFWEAVYEDPAFREEIRKKVLDDVAGGDPERMQWVDIPVTRKGEETTYVTARNIPIPGSSLMISTVWDVTGRKRAKEEIITLNSRLHSLINAIQELASAHTLESVQHIVATSARKLTGADGATMVFRDGDSCYYAEEDAIQPLWKGRRFPLTSCISGWVMLNRTPAVIPDIYADDRIPVEAYKPTFVKSLVMVPVNTTEPVAAIGNYWRNKYSPAAIEIQLLQTLADAASRAVENVRLLDELEQRVRERTAQLEAANRELEAFSYSVSHDLRAPLRAVDGYTRILLEDYGANLDAEGKRVCAVISESARAMGKLIDDLLAFSRVGRTSMAPSAVDMTTMAQSIFHEVTTSEVREGIDFQVRPLPAAVGDPTLFRQVWKNLLANAVKFSSKVKPAVIEVGAVQLGGELVYFVRDNGAGFDMQYADKLFGVFQRLHSSREFEGTGVGLAIVQRIINRHGGRIWAEGEPGKGATFYFTLRQGDEHGPKNHSGHPAGGG